MCAKTLMSFGANINALNVRRQTPLDLATVAWAAQERGRKVVNYSNGVEVMTAEPITNRYSVSQVSPILARAGVRRTAYSRVDSTSSWVFVDTLYQANGGRSGGLEESILEASYRSCCSNDDPREFMDSVQIRLSASEGDEDVKSKPPVTDTPEMAQQLHDMLDLLYSVGALRGKSRKLRFNKIPKIVDSNDFSSELDLERSIKLKDYDEGRTVLSLYEELEDYINGRIDCQLSLSMNPDEAIAMTYQQQEMYQYKKTCKEQQPGIGFEVGRLFLFYCLNLIPCNIIPNKFSPQC